MRKSFHVPFWFGALFVIALCLGVATFTYTVRECGWGKALLLGENGFIWAVTGMCEE